MSEFQLVPKIVITSLFFFNRVWLSHSDVNWPMTNFSSKMLEAEIYHLRSNTLIIVSHILFHRLLVLRSATNANTPHIVDGYRCLLMFEKPEGKENVWRVNYRQINPIRDLMIFLSQNRLPR